MRLENVTRVWIAIQHEFHIICWLQDSLYFVWGAKSAKQSCRDLLCNLWPNKWSAASFAPTWWFLIDLSRNVDVAIDPKDFEDIKMSWHMASCSEHSCYGSREPSWPMYSTSTLPHLPGAELGSSHNHTVHNQSLAGCTTFSWLLVATDCETVDYVIHFHFCLLSAFLVERTLFLIWLCAVLGALVHLKLVDKLVQCWWCFSVWHSAGAYAVDVHLQFLHAILAQNWSVLDPQKALYMWRTSCLILNSPEVICYLTELFFMSSAKMAFHFCWKWMLTVTGSMQQRSASVMYQCQECPCWSFWDGRSVPVKTAQQ